MLKRYLRRHLTAYLQEVLTPAVTAKTATRITHERRRDLLSESAYNNKVSGIRPPAEDETPLIVSLTTHATRLYEVHLTIESILLGSLKPHHVILWIDDNDDRPLPLALERQTARGLKVMRTAPMRSYAKLVPALGLFPDADIVTIDDDIFYPTDFLERLVESHRRYPGAVIANVIMQLTRNAEGIPQEIRDWPYIPTTEPSPASPDLFFEGFGGVLYPAGSMPPETLDNGLFRSLCPTADDVWFNAMTRLAATPVHVCLRSPYDFIAATNPACQGSALNLINNSQRRNDDQLLAVWRHFNLQGK